MCDHVALNVKK